MDFIISYYLYKKIVKKKKIKIMNFKKNKSLLPIIKCCLYVVRIFTFVNVKRCYQNNI